MADAPKLLGTDTLRTAYPKVNMAIDNANEAMRNSEDALDKATQALANSENTQAQLDQIVIEGDSSVEAAQARVDAEGNVFTTLKERLDTKETQFANEIGILSKKSGLSKNIMDYGVKNDGSEDASSLIQQAEDELSALATTLGITVNLEFPAGTYMIRTTINKKSNVNWIGKGIITRDESDTTRLYALVLADNQNNFVIEGLTFKNMPHHIAYNISSSWSKNVRNCCIHTYECTQFTIKDCKFHDYSEGIVRTGCKNYKIINNYLCSNVQGKDISQFFDDSYVNIAGSQTGDITGWVLEADTPKYEEGFIIQGNHCLSVGLRIGIECLTQSSNKTQGIIADNVVKGLHQGIKVYKGTYGTLEDAVTHTRETIIKGNQISYCREIGIYIRANLGVLCTNNFISYCGLYDTGEGTAYGGIVTRISPAIVSTALSMESGNLIANNFIFNCGKSSGSPVSPIGIQVRTPNTMVLNNRIVQESTYTDKTGYGILCGNSDDMENAVVKGNMIMNFSYGIRSENGSWRDTNLMIVYESNEVSNCNFGIFIDHKYKNLQIKSNTIVNITDTGIFIRNSINNYIVSNIMKDCVKGIEIRKGTFFENYNDGTSRVIPTNIVKNNIFTNCNTSHSISETAPGDTTFSGRCLHWSGDVVDGLIKPYSIPSGTTASRPVRPLNVGDSYFDTNLGKIIYVKTPGVREVASLTISAGCTTEGNITISLDGVNYTILLTTSDSTSDLVAEKIRKTIFPGWITGGSGSTVTFTSFTVGNKIDATYDPGTTGATGTMITSTQGTSHVWVDSTGATV